MVVERPWVAFRPWVGAGIALIVLALTCNTAVADDPGQPKLDEATSLKLEANSPAKLAKVIELCEEAIKEGLDEANLTIAKQILAASALQHAKMSAQQAPRANPSQLRRLKSDLMADLKKAIEHDPTLSEAFMLAAQVSMLAPANVTEAIDYVNKAIALLKDSPVDQSSAYMLRARLQPNTDDQLNDYRQATKADPTNMAAWQLQIALQVTIGKLDDAYKDIQALLANDEGNQFAIEAAFKILAELKKYDELLALLEKQIKAKPTEGVYHRLRASVYMFQSAAKDDKELLKKAREDLDKAVELNSRDAQALIQRSQVLYDLGEIEQARRDIGDALLIEPNAIDGVFMRAAIAAREKRYADAIADMELLVRAFPTNEVYVRQLAGYYQMDDRPRLAIRLMDELIKNNKDGWRNLRLRGDARLSVGEHSEAIRDYERAITAIEKAVAEATKKSDSKPETENPEDTEVETPATLKEEHAGLLNNLSWVLATSPKEDIRDGKKALEYALKSCELTEYKEAHILSTLAASYAEMGDFAKAREWSEKAVDLATKEDNEQLDQLKKELESYKSDKPWREEQKTEENLKQRVNSTTIET